MQDISKAEVVQVEWSADKTTLWINQKDGCLLRIQNIEKLIIGPEGISAELLEQINSCYEIIVRNNRMNIPGNLGSVIAQEQLTGAFCLLKILYPEKVDELFKLETQFEIKLNKIFIKDLSDHNKRVERMSGSYLECQ